MRKHSYYTDVIRELLLYREYKQRVIMIFQEEEKRLEVTRNNDISFLSGIDYSKVSVQTSNIFDGTAESALEILDEKMYNEFKYKLDLVKKIEIAYSGLDEVEKFIIRRKYMTGRVVEDIDVYTHPEFPNRKTKYYEQKDNAVKKYAEIRGFI